MTRRDAVATVNEESRGSALTISVGVDYAVWTLPCFIQPEATRLPPSSQFATAHPLQPFFISVLHHGRLLVPSSSVYLSCVPSKLT